MRIETIKKHILLIAISVAVLGAMAVGVMLLLGYGGACDCFPPNQVDNSGENSKISRSDDVKKIKELWEQVRTGPVPKTDPAPLIYPKVKGIFFKGLPYKGKETRVFAWYGLPNSGTPPNGKKWPVVVLVHGGGGTAYPKWVTLWNERGYAAIAIDTNGHVPNKDGENSRPMNPHPDGGPSKWGGFQQMADDIRDNWNFHAVADILLARKLMGALPEVDADRAGVIGISWGACLSLIAASVDPGFKCVVPVYGCGFLKENSAVSDRIKHMGKSGEKWTSTWDASVYLNDLRVPVLWVSGVSDSYFSLPIFQKSYRATPLRGTLNLRPRLRHDELHSRKLREIDAFVAHALKGEPPLLSIVEQGRDKCTAWVTVASSDSTLSAVSAALYYTKSSGPWKGREWQSTGATVEAKIERNIEESKKTQTIRARIPVGTTAYFIGVKDNRNRFVSSEYREIRTVSLLDRFLGKNR
ncbi:MAG: dienelactone hydrolase family protein [Candidatus Omnitrophota bacterium]